MKKNDSLKKAIKLNSLICFFSLTSLFTLLSIHSKAQTYCLPTYGTGSASGDYISLVEIPTTSLNNVSGASSNPFYTFFPNTGASTATLNISSNYSLNVAGGTYGTCYISCWGDWNQDGVFDPSEFIGVSPNVGSLTTAGFTSGITIPSYAMSGVTRLRFRSSDTSPGPGASEACNATNSSYGEGEDYEVYLMPLPPCSGAPVGGNATASNTLICTNTAFNLSLNNNSLSSGISYQWQSSPDGSVWTNVGTAQQSYQLSISSLTASTYYHCISTCTSFTQTSTSTPILVTLNPLINCYCLPSYALNCANGDKFSDFSIANVVFQPSNCDLNGFSDSTSSAFTVVNLTAGNTYSLQANIANSGNGGNMAAGVWIDYNQNGTFDTYEFTYLGNGGTQIYTNNLTVPITAPSGSVRMRLKLDANYATSSTVLDPCNNNNFSNYGQILDYKVNITAAPVCSGAPNAGDAVSTETAVCQNVPYTLDLINNSVASNITYQWQSSLNGTVWTNLGAVQNTIPYSVSTQSTTTYYRCITTCTTSAPISSTSTPVMVTQNLPTACYCVPDNIYCSYMQITNVLFETINDNPICGLNGYSDNTSTVATVSLTANQTYTISSIINSQFGTGYLVGWIDFNQNGNFDFDEYHDLGNTSSSFTLTGNINVPFTAIAGNTRMRLKVISSSSPESYIDPCLAMGFDGQVLDYLIHINPIAACTGTASAGDVTTTYTAICENRPFTLNLTNNAIASNIYYQWQSSTDNVNWVNLGSSQTTVPYSIPSQSITSYYRCLTTCLSSSITSASTTWTVTQNAATDCYCIPDPMDCSLDGVIKYVSFATMTNTSSCGANGYSDFTSTVPSATVVAGQTYTITTVLGYNFGEHAHAWIDCDPNGTKGVFESSEYTDLLTNNGNDTITYNITIPVNATLGTTRMRVRNIISYSLGSSDACSTPTFMPKSALISNVTGSIAEGESEDYLVTILPPDCSVINPPPTIPITGSTNICLGQSTVLDFSSSMPIATGLTYQWKESTGGAYSNVGPNATTFTASPTVNTSYFCEVICNGTTIKNTDTVFVNISSLTISPVVTNSVCNGACNGSITLNATSSSSIIYNWQPAFTSTTDVASGLCAGSYTATITDGQGNCAITNTFVITQPSPFSVSIAGSSSVMCEQLEDTLKSTITGGLAPLSYNWIQLPSTTVSTSADYTYTTSIGVFGYGLTVTDANNCAANSNTISITVNPSSNLSGTVTVFPNTSTPVAGYVTLYRYEPFYVRFDSITYQNIGAAGDYNFVSFTAGNYIVKATPSATNMQVAYGDTAVNWKTANQIIHGCAVNDIQNIQVKPFINIGLGSGPGTLTGVITETVGFVPQRAFGSTSNTSYYKPTVPGTPIGGIVVKGGKNPGGQMFTQTITGPEGTPTAGQYTITGLPYGDYFILVDIPGLDTNNTYHVKITPSDTVFNNLDFTVDSIQINPLNPTDVGVHEINTIESKIKIYPNPASSHVTIQYNLQSSSVVKIELFDILGKSVKTLLPSTQQPKDAYKTSWLLDDLKSGLYFIKMNINGSESTIKLSVTN